MKSSKALEIHFSGSKFPSTKEKQRPKHFPCVILHCCASQGKGVVGALAKVTAAPGKDYNSQPICWEQHSSERT